MKRYLILLLILATSSQWSSTQAQPQVSGYSIARKGTLYWPKLQKGTRYSSVKELQISSVKGLQLLLNVRGAKLTIDGQFGSSTEAAAKRFQKSQRLKVDGIVGYQTWEKLVVPIKRGARGPIVRVFQLLLSKNGYRVKQDGVFGQATEKAVRGYQSEDETGETLVDGRGKIELWCYLLGGHNLKDQLTYGG